MTTYQPLVISYNNYDACKCDNYITLPKETPISVVINTCFEAGCHGFARGSNVSGRGKYYIRSPKHSYQHLKSKLTPYENITFFTLSYPS